MNRILSQPTSPSLGINADPWDVRVKARASLSPGMIAELDMRMQQSTNLDPGDDDSGLSTVIRPTVLGSHGAAPQAVVRRAMALNSKDVVCFQGIVTLYSSGSVSAGDHITVDDATSGRRIYGLALADSVNGYYPALWDGVYGFGQVVDISVPGNDPPVAALTATPSTGTAPQLVDLDASASTDDGTIVEYEFDLGTGAGFESNGSSPTLDRQYYGAAGVYQVSVRVTDDGTPPLQDTATVTLTFTNPDGTTGHGEDGPTEPGDGSGSQNGGGTVGH